MVVTNYELTFCKNGKECKEFCNRSSIFDMIDYRCYHGWSLKKMKKIERKY